MLTEGGHPNVWEYTPREFQAYFILAKRRKRLAMADQLTINALAARGEEDKVNSLRKRWGSYGW